MAEAVHSQPSSPTWERTADVLTTGAHNLQDALDARLVDKVFHVRHATPQPTRDALYILFPLLIVLSTFLFLLLLFLICVIILRRRRGIRLRDHDGPIDMSREDLVEGEGGFETLESRWLEGVSEVEQRMYQRAKRKYLVHFILTSGRVLIQSQSISYSIPRIRRQQT
jgi:hypothetical protein